MKEELFNLIFSSILTAIVYFLGEFDTPLISLLILMILDYISGVISAIYNKKLSSKVGLKGIFKKILMIISIGLSVIVDRLTGDNNIFRLLTIFYYISNEGISILENLIECNVPFPDKLIDILDNLKKDK